MKKPNTSLTRILDIKHYAIGVVGWLLVAGVLPTRAQTLSPMNLGGYLGVNYNGAPESYNAGYSMYTAMLGRSQYAYYSSAFSAGLQPGTWMHPQNSTANCYSDIEGGPGAGGWYGNPWCNNGFGMGVVGPDFAGVTNGSTGGWGQHGAYAVAQISPRLLFPPQVEMFRGGTCGQFAGYGYFALPLLPGKATTDGVNVPTGDHWWTLFFNSRNFQGPVATVIPYFWSQFTKTHPEWGGQLLDSRWVSPNKPMSSESHDVPGKLYDGPEGSYVRVEPMFVALNNGANGTIVMNSPTVYDQTALWNAAQQWFTNNGPAPVGPFNTQGAVAQTVTGGDLGWGVYASSLQPNGSMPMAMANYLTPHAPDTMTLGYQWGSDQVEFTQFASGTPAAKMPEYYQLQEGVWTPISPEVLPPNVASQLASVNLADSPPVIGIPGTWTAPNDPCWTTPGPAAGPFQTRLDDGMVVTYYWYRFADQPAIMMAGLTQAERDQLQTEAVKMHTSWTNGGTYLAPPTMGTLADVDPALLVTPPAGKEVGYVPIATSEAWGGFVANTWKNATSGNLSAAANWASGSAPADGGHSYYSLNFTPSGTYTVTNDLGSGYGYGGYAVNQLNFAGAVTINGNPITLTTDCGSLPQINQKSGGAVVINAPLNLDVTTVLGGTGNGLVDITNGISGPWQGLTINSPGTWRLSGNNTYSGATDVQAGTLSCSQAASLGSGALKINNGAVVNLNYSGTRTISALTLGGANMPAGVYGSPGSPATYKDSHFSGAGTVTVPVLATGPKGTGSISREVWTGVSGTAVTDIPVGTPPNTSDTLTSFEGPTGWADNYGTRIRGYITAPDTGSYTFWIASDGNSELWLSADNQAANKVKIAEVTSYTASREWNKYASQRSVAINLIAGRQYYVEALQKEGAGGDNVAVGWAKPGESASSPSEVIPGAQLSPYVPKGSGSISREVWTGVAGSSVSTIPVGTTPNISDTLNKFEVPADYWADNYGTRIRGYITAPYTGTYTFWVASDDNSELWLSTDDQPANKIKIAEVTGYTSSREWNKFTSQKSTAINLTAGSRYYVEALHKEVAGEAHVAVGWAKPGESASSPSGVISGAQLSPYIGRGTGVAPTGLGATPGVSQVVLSWTAAPGATGYIVKRSSTSDGPYAVIGTTAGTASYTDSKARNGTTYYYVVSASNAAGESYDSNQASATPNADLLLPPYGVTDLALWLDASQLTGLSDGNTVDTWTDMSGNANNAAKTAGSPIYKTGVLNGRPVIRFNDASAFTTADLSSQFPSAATVFIVTTINNDNKYTLVNTKSGVDEWWRYDGDGKSYPALFRSSRLNGYCAMPTTGSHLFAISSSASAWEMWNDGASQGVAGAGYNAGGVHVIGSGSSGEGLNGDIAEILIYSRTLTANELLKIGGYLTVKYDLNTSYPNPAPQANILTFGPGAAIGPVAANAASISWIVPSGSNPAALSPTFILSDGATCTVLGLPVLSGSTQNFTDPVHYIVYSSDYVSSPAAGTFTDYTVTVIVDSVPPTLTSFVDNKSGGPTFAGQTVTYTVTFSEGMDPATVDVSDFDNAGSPAATINSVSTTGNPAVFLVVASPTAAGTLRLRVAAGATLTDLRGNLLNPALAIPDETIITVNAPPNLACQLGVLDLSANGWINPATGNVWQAGDKYRLIFVTRADTACVSTDITTYNSFVQGLAAASTAYPKLGSVTWKVVGSTASVAARDNTDTNPVEDGVGEPIYRMDGLFVIANNYADLWNGINSTHVPDGNYLAVHLDENGAARIHERVRTGSIVNGTAAGAVLGASGSVQTGRNYAPNHYGGYGSGGWMQDWSEAAATPGPVYAMSETLTIVTGATPYDTWANGTFANPFTDKDPAHDPDGDGQTNQEEFAFGLDPTTGASVNPISRQLDQTTGVFKYTRTKDSGLTYIYQSSTTLSDPWDVFTPVSAVSNDATPVEEITVTVPLLLRNESKLFLRVKAE